ncbi:hypothetical protein [Actinophytocola xanthii]|uniref:Uncharacterized protein n=1 Tax=Actinophytocola xanthii TaxID=1912961 RepID=A0A1Q8C6E5_9PSEU|nr:hypothetical protein [Actinophytocola xanthii]OLF09922.1 hypothetical protein BU204_32410 [Actinophytocola xanthii]
MSRTLWVALVVVATVVLGTTGQAQAARAAHTFDRGTTERIHTVAHAAGAGGLTALCASVAPGWVTAIGCPVFARVVMEFVPDRPPAGRCLQVFARWGLPPIGVRYVGC